LRDDDRATGGTLAAVVKALPPGVHIARSEFALSPEAGEEVVDSRDFLLGASNGGLVVQLPSGAITRVPYLLPYADPSVRSGIPPTRVKTFSVAVWRAERRVVEGTAHRRPTALRTSLLRELRPRTYPRRPGAMARRSARKNELTIRSSAPAIPPGLGVRV
jgi:hypothetical protein